MENTKLKSKSKVKGVVWKRGAWWLDYTCNGRRRREKVGGSLSLAENAMNKIRVEIAENRFLDIRREKKIRFEEFADDFFEQYCKPNHKSCNKSSGTSLKVLKRFFSGKYLQEITPQCIERFKAERLKDVSPATVNRALAVLKSLFNRAIDWGKFDAPNPVRKVKFLKEPPGRLKFLEKEEIDKLIAGCCNQLRPIVVLAVNTGMRRGEIFNLKWQDIDFARNIIYLYNTKNGEKREIFLNTQAREALISVKKHIGKEYVFCREDGSLIRDIRKSFFTALGKAGIINFRFHDLRHTFASQLAMAGVDLNTIRELLGHKSLDMTIKYSHLSPNHRKRAVEVLGEKIGTSLALPQMEHKKEESIISATV